MRKLTMTLVVLALLMAFPAAVGAKKEPPAQDRKHEGFTCKQAVVEGVSNMRPKEWDGVGIIRFTLTPDDRGICIDLTNKSAGTITVTATNHSDATRGFGLILRDSDPGDICFGPQSTVFADGIVESFYVDVLAAEMDVCGEDFSDADKALAFTLVAAFKGNAAKAEGEVDVEITMVPSDERPVMDG